MEQDLSRARALLEQGGYTCVLCKGDTVYTSTHRGVAPLMEHLEEGTDLQGFSAADKVVGKATAFLYCLLKVRALYALVISQAAVAVLEENGIPFSFDTMVPAIRNRAGDGLCPMEMATKEVSDPADAPAAIRAALARLQGK